MYRLEYHNNNARQMNAKQNPGANNHTLAVQMPTADAEINRP